MEIVLYGAGELGQTVLSNLRRRGEEVSAFLDKKARGTICGAPVLRPGDERLDERRRASALVIICLNAGMEHREVAEELYGLGFRHMIFLPLGYALSHDERRELTRIYNEALAGRVARGSVKDYEKYRSFRWEAAARIRQDEDRITAWLGRELLFSEDVHSWRGDIRKVHVINGGIDVNLHAAIWMDDLFDYLDGKRDECDSYLSIYGLESGSEAALCKLRDRARLCAELKKELGFGMDYFIQAAPEAYWNVRGYFNIAGGNHRTVFLQRQGYAFYPVKMEAEDYETWTNREAFSEIQDYIRASKIEGSYVPVPHPYFLNFPYRREGLGQSVLAAVMRFLGPVRLCGKRVLDMSQYEGYFARITSRMCAERAVCYGGDPVSLGFAERTARLLRLENIDFISGRDSLWEAVRESDLVFAMLNGETLLSDNVLEGFEGMLFIEFRAGQSDLAERFAAGTQLKRYRPLHREVVDGELLEIGVLRAEL